MRRADRLLQIIQIFRRRRGPVTAARIAEELEVTARTVYRDIAALMANGVPIRGEAGVGYVMDEGYDLPPLMFDAEELEALMLGARLVVSTGDTTLARAARDAVAKIATVIPSGLRPNLLDAPLLAPNFGMGEAGEVDIGTIRMAIREGRKLRIDYRDAKDAATTRTIWPIALGYFQEVKMLAAFCELRSDFRHFRLDRIGGLTVLDARPPEHHARLFHRWWQAEVEKCGDRIAPGKKI